MIVSQERVRSLERRLREAEFALHAKVQQVAMLIEVVAYATEGDDLTLWQRIGFQRRALRQEIRLRTMYEKWWRDTSRENDALKLRLKQVEASLGIEK